MKVAAKGRTEETRTGVVVNGVLKGGHKGSAVEVAFDPGKKWGIPQVVLSPGRRGYAVVVLVNRKEVASAIVSRMRRFFVLVPESVAEQAGVSVGDHVRLVVRPADADQSLPTDATPMRTPKRPVRGGSRKA
jgi:hypothetical protein